VISPELDQIAALEAEFPGFQVWTDFRPRDDGGRHWHARQSGWSPRQIISALDAADMREKLRTAARAPGTGTAPAPPP
jgi:hypothetical protein